MELDPSTTKIETPTEPRAAREARNRRDFSPSQLSNILEFDRPPHLPRSSSHQKDPNRIYITWEGNIILEWFPDSRTPASIMAFYHQGAPEVNPLANFSENHNIMRFNIGCRIHPQEVIFQGNEEHGVMVHGHTTNGNTIYGSTTNGYTVFGPSAHGSTIFGDTIDGSTVYGNTITGTTIYGDTTEGRTFFGRRIRRNELLIRQ